MRWNTDKIREIIFFALPIAVSSMLQQLFNTVDSAVLGRFANASALAAVGVAAPIVGIIVSGFVGIAEGGGIAYARSEGAKDSVHSKEVTDTAMILSVICGLAITLIGIFFCRQILVLIDTPESVIPLAKVYLRIYFLGMPFMMFYDFGSAILRGSGDSKRPTAALILAGVLNLILNLFFVIVCRMTVVGVALATVISNGLSAALVLEFLIRGNFWKLSGWDFRLDTAAEIARIGIPSGITGIVFSLSNIFVQTAINGIGAAAVAAGAVCLNIEYMVFYLMNGFAQACSTFVSRAYGAKDYRECFETIRRIVILSTVFTFLFSIIIVAFRGTIMGWFTTETAVITYGVIRIAIVVSMQMFNAFQNGLVNSIRALGKSMTATIVSLAGICAVRTAWIFLIYPITGTYQMLMFSYGASFLATDGIALIVLYGRMRKLKLLWNESI